MHTRRAEKGLVLNTVLLLRRESDGSKNEPPEWTKGLGLRRVRFCWRVKKEAPWSAGAQHHEGGGPGPRAEELSVGSGEGWGTPRSLGRAFDFPRFLGWGGETSYFGQI